MPKILSDCRSSQSIRVFTLWLAVLSVCSGSAATAADESAERVQAALPAFVFSDTCRTRVVRARHGD